LKNYCEKGYKNTKEIETKNLRKFEGEKLCISFEKIIGDNINMCFSLAGGEEEERWIYGWESIYKLLYKEGRAYEKDVLFREKASTTAVFYNPDLSCYWYATIHNPETYTFESVLYIPGLFIGKFHIDLEEVNSSETKWSNEFSFTSLSEQGTRILERPETLNNMTGMSEFIANSADYYVKNRRKMVYPSFMRKMAIIKNIIKYKIIGT